MGAVAEAVFEPLRMWVGNYKNNSFFRCEELNKAIGGSSRSQHCEGRAMDLDDVHGHKTNAEMFTYIKENLNFDQLISGSLGTMRTLIDTCKLRQRRSK